MTRSTYLYVAYIRTTPERLWSALTDDSEFMKAYWFGMHGESDWKAGSPWKLVSDEGNVYDAGEILEADPPRKLVIRWAHQFKPELRGEGDTICTMELEPSDTSVKLSITHTSEQENSRVIEAVSGGWPKVISNLKSLIETGVTAMGEPYPAKATEAARA